MLIATIAAYLGLIPRQEPLGRNAAMREMLRKANDDGKKRPAQCKTVVTA